MPTSAPLVHLCGQDSLGGRTLPAAISGGLSLRLQLHLSLPPPSPPLQFPISLSSISTVPPPPPPKAMKPVRLRCFLSKAIVPAWFWLIAYRAGTAVPSNHLLAHPNPTPATHQKPSKNKAPMQWKRTPISIWPNRATTFSCTTRPDRPFPAFVFFRSHWAGLALWLLLRSVMS